MDMARVDAIVPAGEAELWEIENGTGTAHDFNLHGTGFRVLGARQDELPPGP
jgi:FtsP/CotA-like multicopper oxidase with cupredoxin domain